MTLEALKDSWQHVATGHTGITKFHFGESFNTDKFQDSNTYYPLFYLELPYSINYSDKKSVTFAIVVLFKSKFDNPIDDHRKISQAESIADSILQQYDLTYRNSFFRIQSANGVSMERYTDDVTCGVRIEITGIANRYCYSIEDFL